MSCLRSTRESSCHEMKYYKPLFYSAVTVIYASFAFRVCRLGLLSRALRPNPETKEQTG
jgi:hypothetical protein